MIGEQGTVEQATHAAATSGLFGFSRPLERFATADEIVGFVSDLASEESRYVTGEVFDVNGGIDL